MNYEERYMLYIFDQINKEKDEKEAAEKESK